MKGINGTPYCIKKVIDYIYFHKYNKFIFLDKENEIFKKNTKNKASLPEIIKKTEVTKDN